MRLAPRAGLLLMFAAILGVGAFFTVNSKVALAFLLLGGTFSCIALLSWLVRYGAIREAQKLQEAVIGLVQKDAMACVMTDCDGLVSYMNDAATRRFTARLENNGASTLTALLRGLFANPAAVLYRMQERALEQGAAHEDMVTRRGHIRLNVHQVHDDRFLWRLEEMADRGVMRGEGAALPMLTVGRNDAILFMNDAARRFLGARVRTLDLVFPELPVKYGRRNAISTATGIRHCVVAEITGQIGKREIYLVPVHETQALEPDDGFLDDLPVALLKIAPDGALLLSNRLARNLLGIKTHEGMQLSALMEGLGRSITDWLGEAATGQVRHHSEVLRLTRQDREMFVQVTLNRVQQDGKAVLVAVLNDATEMKTLEAQFVQGQKMQAIGQLAGGIAHDFNNLLTAISGHCDLLLLRHDQSDQDYPDLVQINQNANRAASLVGQLLAFSRKQTLQPEILDLRETLSDLTHLLNRLVGEKVRLSLSHQPDLQAIRADKRQLEQVLMNLVVNARDAMPEGGEIRIETSSLTVEEAIEWDRATVAEGSYVVVKVRDEGTGIPADKLPKIFEPFFTTKRIGEGTGLGLSTVYGIVKQTGGFIFVDSDVTEGSCFTLLFPVHHEEQSEERAIVEASPALPVKHADGVVLLVEDEAPVRAFASRALRMRGYTVIEADSAEAALRTLEDKSLKVDIFVTDVVMPGMDGPSWVCRALADRPGVRVVFVSGYAEETFGETQARIPNSVFLPKPFSLADLTETVQRQLH